MISLPDDIAYPLGEMVYSLLSQYKDIDNIGYHYCVFCNKRTRTSLPISRHNRHETTCVGIKFAAKMGY